MIGVSPIRPLVLKTRLSAQKKRFPFLKTSIAFGIELHQNLLQRLALRHGMPFEETLRLLDGAADVPRRV